MTQTSRAGPECSVFDKQKVNEREAMDPLCHLHTEEGWKLHHGEPSKDDLYACSELARFER